MSTIHIHRYVMVGLKVDTRRSWDDMLALPSEYCTIKRYINMEFQPRNRNRKLVKSFWVILWPRTTTRGGRPREAKGRAADGGCPVKEFSVACE